MNIEGSYLCGCNEGFFLFNILECMDYDECLVLVSFCD